MNCNYTRKLNIVFKFYMLLQQKSQKACFIFNLIILIKKFSLYKINWINLMLFIAEVISIVFVSELLINKISHSRN